MASFRFGFGPLTDRGYADQLDALVREWALGRAFDDFGRFARNPVQPRNPAITPVSAATPAVPFPSSPPLVPVPGLPGGLPPPTVPGLPGGGTIPDTMPGRPAIGAVLSSILRGGWIGALFYPSANPRGRGSQLCIETEYGPWCPPGMPAVPAPAAPGVLAPGRGRRRPRAVPAAPGRRRRVRPIAQPIGPPRPRGRLVTISQPRIEVSPATAAVIRTPPASSRPPPVPASIPQAQEVSLPRSGTIAAPRPATIPAPATPGVLPTLASIVLPAIGAWVSSIPGNVLPRIAAPSIAPGVLPGLGGLPIIGPSPTPALNPALSPLTQFNAVRAPSAANELDRQCRERAKQRRKKRKPRTECWKGSYVETRKGTLKKRREKIRCQ